MVKYLMCVFLLVPLYIFSGQFTASVTSNKVNIGESITLNLSLREATAKGNPSVAALRQSFYINSQQQSSNTVIKNGQVSTSTSWRLVLIPQQEGELLIPAISIETSDGTLTSQPIKLQVVKGTPSGNSETEGMVLTTDVSTAKPYKNQPVFYTVKLTSKHDLANLQMQKMSLEDAIVEPIGEPKISEEIINGENVGIIEYSYLITPLKAGPLKIPSTIIQGGILTRRKNLTGSAFFENFHSFDRLKPFGLTTEEIVLDVQLPAPGVVPWLPASSFKIEEIWDESQTIQAGEPFTRGFKITAQGIKSSQLPDLSEQQDNDDRVKIYSDKPQLGDEITANSVVSYRKEQYTLIPKTAGDLTLPEIAVSWWDADKKEKVVATIPARTLHVQPSIQATNSPIAATVGDSQPASAPVAAPEAVQRDPLLYGLIAGLAVLLFAVILWAIALQRKIVRLTEKPTQKTAEKKKNPSKDKNEKLPDLNPT